MSRVRLRGATLAAVLAMVANGGCSSPPRRLPDCAGLRLDDAGPFALPIETTAAGACLAARADGGDAIAALALGDRYRLTPGPLPLIDRAGHQIHWYRLAADNGSATGAWRAAQALDGKWDRLMPADALAYLILAIRRQVPAAIDHLVRAWREGRIDRDAVWALRQWADRPGALPQALRIRLLAGLGQAPGPLKAM